MGFKTIRINETFDDQVIELTLNMPPANILSAPMMGEILLFMQQQRKHDKLKLVVFKGEGKNFCFGASIEEHTADQVSDMLQKFHNLIDEILGHPVPTLAQVSGYCLGGGFELALACTFIVADETAKFSVPEIRLGVFPPVAAVLLPYVATNSVTARMIITGTMMDAQGLKDAGLTALIAEKGDIQAAVDTFIKEEIIPKSSSSLRFAHRATRLSLVRHYRSLIKDMEKLYLNDLMKTHDANEGIQSFIEKRTPIWRDN